MKKVLLLTICLLSGLHAASSGTTSVRGDQDNDLSLSSASSISPSDPRASFIQCEVLQSLSFSNFFNATAYNGPMQFENLQNLHLGTFDIPGVPEEEEIKRHELQTTVAEFFKTLSKLNTVSFVLPSSIGPYVRRFMESWQEQPFRSHQFINRGGYTQVNLTR